MRNRPLAVLVGASPEVELPLRLPASRSRIQLIAVDGGYHACLRRRWRPDLCVGDWDSSDSPPLDPHLTLPRDKDRSDFYFALRAAHAAGAREVLAYGVTGGRPDHHLASLQDLAEAATWKGLRSVCAIDARGHYALVHRALRLRLKRGQIFSVLAWPGQAQVVSIQGAVRFRLKKEPLEPGSRGLSNQSLGGEVRISVRGGGLLVFVEN